MCRVQKRRKIRPTPRKPFRMCNAMRIFHGQKPQVRRCHQAFGHKTPHSYT